MFEKLKQLQQLRHQAKELQKQLAKEVVRESVLDDKIVIIMDGNQKVKSCQINPELLSSTRKEELERGLIEAFNGAIGKVHYLLAGKMQGMSALNLPL